MPLLIINSSVVNTDVIGHSGRIVRAVYSLAQMVAPSIVFIEKADELFSTRESDSQNSGFSPIKAAMVCSIEQSENVLTIAASNFPWEIDQDFIRLLENQIFFNLPNVQERQEIIISELKKRDNTIQGYEIPFIAKKLDGYSCYDISMVVKDAHKLAYRRMSQMSFFQKSKATGKWVPCRENDKFSCSAKLSDFLPNSGSIFEGKEYDYLPIDMLDMEMAVKNRKSSIKKSTLDQFKTYFNGSCESD